MKDIINLNAKETNIAIVWAIMFIVGMGIHLILPTINSVHLVMCGFVVLCVAHCFLDNGFVRSNQKTIAVCDDVICGLGMVGADWIVALFFQFYDHNVFI